MKVGIDPSTVLELRELQQGAQNLKLIAVRGTEEGCLTFLPQFLA
jgi:hypothetical protein